MPAAKIFGIVKQGVRMTAMPSRAKTQSDHTIWGITAFLKNELPKMIAQQYAAISAPGGE